MDSNAKGLVSLSISPEQLGEAQGALAGISNGVNRALAGAVNKTLAKGKTAVKRGLTQLLTIAAGNLARRLFVRPASASSDAISGSLSIMGRPIGLANFQVKDTRPKAGWGTRGRGHGVIATVLRGGAPVVLPNAFIAPGINGVAHVFQRTTFGGRVGTREGRLPIATQFSQKLYDLYSASELAESVPAGMQADLSAQCDSQISRLLAGR